MQKLNANNIPHCPCCDTPIQESITVKYDVIHNNNETILEYIRCCKSCNNEYIVYKTMPTMDSAGEFIKGDF